MIDVAALRNARLFYDEPRNNVQMLTNARTDWQIKLVPIARRLDVRAMHRE